MISIIHRTKYENELTELEDLKTGDWGGRSTAKGEDSWPREVCGWLPMKTALMKDIKYENELTEFEDIETDDWGWTSTPKGEDSWPREVRGWLPMETGDWWLIYIIQSMKMNLQDWKIDAFSSKAIG